MKEYIFARPNVVTLKEAMHDAYFRGEVIRCKDCKHWRANTQFCSVFSSLNIAHRMPPEGYCSEAERKEE